MECHKCNKQATRFICNRFDSYFDSNQNKTFWFPGEYVGCCNEHDIGV